MNNSWASNKSWTSHEQFQWSSESNSSNSSNSSTSSTSMGIELSQIVHVRGNGIVGGRGVLSIENNAFSAQLNWSWGWDWTWQVIYFETTTCVFRQWILKLLHVCPDNGLMSNTCLFNYFQEKSKLFFAQASALLLLLILIQFVNTFIYMMNVNNVGTQYYLLNKQNTMGEVKVFSLGCF